MPERSSDPVAQLVSLSDTNPQYNNIKENQLLLLYNETNLKKGRVYLKELFSRVEIISGKQKLVFSAYLFFLENGCSFAKDLQKQLGYGSQSAHRIIEKLYTHGFIFPVTKTNIHRRAGPKTSLYGVEDVTQDEVTKAITRDQQYSSKNYMHVERLYQRTLTEINREAIQFSKIVSLAKRQGGLTGFHFIDLAELTARKLALNGVKVWR